jgi:hypothetical protein
MHFSRMIGLCLVVTLVFAPTGVSSQELEGGVELGPWKVRPSLSVKEQHTDNVFLESGDEKDDWITTVTPGLDFELPFWDHLFQLAYRADLIYYADYDEYDTDDHLASALLKFDFPVGVQVKCADEFISSSTPPDWEDDVRNDFYYNSASLEASYGISELYKVQLKYTNRFKDYESMPYGPGHKMEYDPELDNFTENDVSATFFYQFSPLTSLLLEYGFSHINNEDKGLASTDSDSQRFWAGVKWEATALVSGTIKGGYYERDYEVPDDWSGFALLGDLTYRMTPFTTFTLALSREAKETSVTAEEGAYGTYYISTGGRLSVTHLFPNRLSASAHISYRNDDYREKGYVGIKREDDRIGAGCGIDYAIQDWLGCGLSFAFVDNDSNFEFEDYRENRVTAHITLAL